MPTIEERLAVVETKVEAMKEDIEEIKANTGQLLTAFNMGKGGFWMAAKIGGLLLCALGGLAWLADHVPAWLK